MLTYSIDPTGCLITTEARGTVAFSDVLVHVQKLVQDPRFDRNYDALVCISGDTVWVSSDSQDELDTFLMRYRDFRRGASVAIVVEGALQRAMLDMTLLAVRRRLGGVRLCRSREEAKQWLTEQRDRSQAPATRAGDLVAAS